MSRRVCSPISAGMRGGIRWQRRGVQHVVGAERSGASTAMAPERLETYSLDTWSVVGATDWVSMRAPTAVVVARLDDDHPRGGQALFSAAIDRLVRNEDLQGLRNLLDKNSARICRSATAALADLGDIERLSMALSDTDEEVRYEAVQGFKELSGTEVVRAIAAWVISDVNDDVWLSAYEALRRVSADPGHDIADCWQDCGTALLKQGRAWRGSQCLWQAIEKCGGWNTRIGAVATVFFNNQLYEESVKACDLYLENEPDGVRALGLKGCALAELGKHEEGIASLKRALSVESDNILVRKALLAAYMGSGGYSQARALAEETRKLHPDDLKVVVNLIECRIHSGDLKEARSLIEEGRAIQGANAEDRGWLLHEEALLHVMTGSDDLAIDVLQDAIRACPQEQQHYRVLDALLMIRNFGGGVTGDPQMRRAKLLGLAEKRSRAYMNWAHFM